MALAALSKKGHSKRNWAVFIGSIIPDAFIYVCWTWLTFVKNEPQNRIWSEIYFEPPMQLTASLFNSIPIYIGLALLGWSFRAKLWAKGLMFFAVAALIHIAFDFPVHNDDAYAHFWPFSDWKFISPISYWDPHHHSGIVSIIESIIAIGAITILWLRFPQKWAQLTLAGLGMLYASLIVFRLFLGSQVGA